MSGSPLGASWLRFWGTMDPRRPNEKQCGDAQANNKKRSRLEMARTSQLIGGSPQKRLHKLNPPSRTTSTSYPRSLSLYARRRQEMELKQALTVVVPNGLISDCPLQMTPPLSTASSSRESSCSGLFSQASSPLGLSPSSCSAAHEVLNDSFSDTEDLAKNRHDRKTKKRPPSLALNFKCSWTDESETKLPANGTGSEPKWWESILTRQSPGTLGVVYSPSSVSGPKSSAFLDSCLRLKSVETECEGCKIWNIDATVTS